MEKSLFLFHVLNLSFIESFAKFHNWTCWNTEVMIKKIRRSWNVYSQAEKFLVFLNMSFNYWHLNHKQIWWHHKLIMHFYDCSTGIFGKTSPSCYFVENDNEARSVLNKHYNGLLPKFTTYFYLRHFRCI